MQFKDDKAIYLQIADYFYEKILKEEMMNGQRIPSVRDLAVELAVNTNTVMRTYRYLQENKIIYNKRGIGYFITNTALEATKNIKKNEFIESILPDFFKSIDLLNISLKEITDFYEKYRMN